MVNLYPPLEQEPRKVKAYEPTKLHEVDTRDRTEIVSYNVLTDSLTIGMEDIGDEYTTTFDVSIPGKELRKAMFVIPNKELPKIKLFDVPIEAGDEIRIVLPTGFYMKLLGKIELANTMDKMVSMVNSPEMSNMAQVANFLTQMVEASGCAKKEREPHGN